MSLVIGPLVLNGTDAQNAVLAPAAQIIAASPIGARIKNVQVWFQPSSKMPRRADGGPSVGYTQNAHHVDLWDRLKHYLAAETLEHEILHVFDDQCGNAQMRADAMALMTPAATKWNSPGYGDDAYETFACYGSAAEFGLVKPPYTRFYSHVVLSADWPALKAVIDKDYGAPTPTPPPQPTPADPVVLQAQIDALETLLAQRAAAFASITAIAAPLSKGEG